MLDLLTDLRGCNFFISDTYLSRNSRTASVANCRVILPKACFADRYPTRQLPDIRKLLGFCGVNVISSRPFLYLLTIIDAT